MNLEFVPPLKKAIRFWKPQARRDMARNRTGGFYKIKSNFKSLPLRVLPFSKGE